MESLDYWRLCDELTIVQAAILIAGADPSSITDNIERWDVEKRPAGYEAAKAALSNALLRGKIDGNLVPKLEYDFNGNECGELPGTVDIHSSFVKVEALRQWLADRGFKRGFFFPEGADRPDYLNPGSPRYAPKLAAAVHAWEQASNSSLLKGKTPKKALSKWLREHAAEYGLTGEDGLPNETGIEEIAKVANWQPTGGAPKTPN